MSKNKISRSEFLSYSALAGAAGVIGVPTALTGCGSGKQSAEETGYVPLQGGAEIYIPDVRGGKAIAGRRVKAGVIGCGGRGSGAANNFLDCADDVTITALADLFPDKLQILRDALLKRGVSVADDSVYYGFDAYRQLIDNADIDMVIIATPTLFHPYHMKYAVDNGKHVFVEKPAAVDAAGCRTVLAACKVAEAKGVSVVTGTQYHHSPAYIESCKRIREGWLGEIVSGNCYYNQGGTWFIKRKEGWSDIEYMVRDFFNWHWLSGDFILDQCVHYIDVFGWITNLKPVSALGMGGRAQRTEGNIYDFITADLVYEGGVHCHAMSRQINECANLTATYIYGTKGWWNTLDFGMRDYQGNVHWKWDGEAYADEYPIQDPYILEHADLVNHIRRDDPICLGEVAAHSAAICNMARESAYSGQLFTFEEFMNSDLNYMPEDIKLGPYPGGIPPVRLPGKSNG